MQIGQPLPSSFARFSSSLPHRPQSLAAGPPTISGASIPDALRRALAGSSGWQRFPRAPEINPASPASTQAYARAIDARLVGGADGRAAITRGGANPWTNEDGRMAERITVGWALQQNPHVKYDVDRRTFFVQDATGRRQDVAGLDELAQVIDGAGGLRNDNGAAMQAVGAFLAGRIPSGPRTSRSAKRAPATPPPQAEPCTAPKAKKKKKKKGLFGKIAGGLAKAFGGAKGLIGKLVDKCLGGLRGGLGGGIGDLLRKSLGGGLGGLLLPAPLRALTGLFTREAK